MTVYMEAHFCVLGTTDSPLPVTVSYLNFQPLEVVARCRDTQLPSGWKFLILLIWDQVFANFDV